MYVCMCMYIYIGGSCMTITENCRETVIREIIIYAATGFPGRPPGPPDPPDGGPNGTKAALTSTGDGELFVTQSRL